MLSLSIVPKSGAVESELLPFGVTKSGSARAPTTSGKASQASHVGGSVPWVALPAEVMMKLFCTAIISRLGSLRYAPPRGALAGKFGLLQSPD